MASSFSKAMEKDNLMILDGMNLAFRYKHAKKQGFAGEYLATVNSLATSYKARKVLVLSDGGSKYRVEIDSGYKGARKELRKEQSEEEAKEFTEFMNDWQMAFELCGTKYSTLRFDGVEADDIAAYIATEKEVLSSFKHIWLVSTDRDWDLLIQDNVSRFSYRTRKEVRLDNFFETYGYTPEQHISVKVLQGDKSDSIEGVAGIGEKRAAALVREYGTAYDIYDSLPIDDKRAYIQNLNNSGDLILKNYLLMDLESYSREAIGDNIEHVDMVIQEELLC